VLVGNISLTPSLVALSVLASALIAKLHRVNIDSDPSSGLVDIGLRRTILQHMPTAGRGHAIGRIDKAWILADENMAILHYF
jgi:hypothetical protein